MMLGVHTSIAGGLHTALLRGKALGCDLVQIFTQAPSRWSPRALSPEEVTLFRETARRTGVAALMTHAVYLVNLGSPCPAVAKRSLDALERELERAESLGIPFVVLHPGAHMGQGEGRGLIRVARRLDALHRRTSGFRAQVLLENTSGQGTSLGHTFEQLAMLIRRVREPERLGVCLDTCHLHAAGYDLREGYRETMERMDRVLGPCLVKAIHLNDARTRLGSRVDRHEHIGKGAIGREGFLRLLGDPRFRDVPMVLETPKGDGDGQEEDRRNLAAVRRLAAAAAPSQPARAGRARASAQRGD